MGTAIAVRLVRPEAAEGRTRELYDEIRETMGLPWVPAMFQAFAAHSRYLEVAWRELRPLVGAAPFERAAADVRRLGDEAVAAFPPTDHSGALRARGYYEDDFDAIRRTLEPFHHGNPRLTVMASVLHDALRGRPVGTNVSPEASRKVSVPAFGGTVRLVYPDEAEGKTRDLFETIRRDLGLPFVNNDYQALACWPDYLEMGWYDLRQHLGAEPYRQAELRIRNRVGVAMPELPGPVYSDAASLRHAGIQEGDLAQVVDLVKLFHGLLPGLILNVAFLRRGLSRPGAARPTGTAPPGPAAGPAGRGRPPR